MLRKIRLRCSQSYTVYYGTGETRRLSEFDLAVVEPQGQNEDNVQILKKSGTLALAYLSVVEINPGDPLFRELENEDFLTVGGKPVINQVCGNLSADLRSSRWQRTLMHLSGRLLLLGGYDGLFLDTIGNVEANYLPQEVRSVQVQAAVEFVRELKKRFPEHLLVQNNGLERLIDHTVSNIDGVCWENPPVHASASQAWVGAVTGKLRELQMKQGLKVLLLCEKTAGAETGADRPWVSVRQMAEENGFLFSLSPKDYLGIE